MSVLAKAFLAAAILVLGQAEAFGAAAAKSAPKLIGRDEFKIRDPFVLPDAANGRYCLYAALNGSMGVQAYTSRDLVSWTPPTPVMRVPPEWKCSSVWAPEVHKYRSKYWLFATLTFNDAEPKPTPVAKDWMPMVRRGTWAFRADSPLGPFKPVKNGSLTPRDWMALDGTLYVEDGIPWMVFCHEWVQLIDGTVALQQLAPDLSDAVGAPKTLFAASIAPGAKTGAREGKVTDGPFLYKSAKNGALLMIWSTFISNGRDYCVMVSRSKTGRVAGPWLPPTPLYTRHGGHGMLFRTFEGQLVLALHQPNSGATERLHLFALDDQGDTLKIVSELPSKPKAH